MRNRFHIDWLQTELIKIIHNPHWVISIVAFVSWNFAGKGFESCFMYTTPNISVLSAICVMKLGQRNFKNFNTSDINISKIHFNISSLKTSSILCTRGITTDTKYIPSKASGIWREIFLKPDGFISVSWALGVGHLT